MHLTMAPQSMYLQCQGPSLTSMCFMQGHPYRNICDLRHGASTSLIELEFASHTGMDADTSPRVPSGLPFYTLNAQLRELELFFLHRFLQVVHLAISLLICDL